MNTILKVGQEALTADAIVPLLSKYQMWPQLLEGVLIDQAIASMSYTLIEKKNALQSFYTKAQLDSVENRQEWLQQRDITMGQLEQWVEKNYRLTKFKAIVWGAMIEDHFNQCKPDLNQVIYSSIQVDDKALALDIHSRLQNNTDDFSELAERYSQSPIIRSTIVKGPVELGHIHPEISHALLDSGVGQFSSIIEVGDQFMIVRLEEVRPAELNDRMRQRLLDELFEEWVDDQVNNILARSRPHDEAVINFWN